VVVLNQDKVVAPPFLLRQAGAVVARMEVGGCCLGLEGVEGEQFLHLLTVIIQSGGAFQIADVLGEVSKPPAGYAESVLQIRTVGKNGGKVPLPGDGQRGVAPTGAQ